MSYEIIISYKGSNKIIILKAKTITEALEEAMQYQKKDALIAVRKANYESEFK